MRRRSKAFCWMAVGLVWRMNSSLGLRAVTTACERREVGDQALEAVNRQAVGGRAVGMFSDGGGRALRLGDDAGAERFEHAQGDVSAHARRRPMESPRMAHATTPRPDALRRCRQKRSDRLVDECEFAFERPAAVDNPVLILQPCIKSLELGMIPQYVRLLPNSTRPTMRCCVRRTPPICRNSCLG